MPSYEQKKTSVILRNSVGSLIQAMPETEAGNVLYQNATVESALQGLDAADITEGYSELETETETETAESEVHHRISIASRNRPIQIVNELGLIPLFWILFGYSYDNNGSTSYSFQEINSYDSFIESNAAWTMDVELEPQNYQAISFGICGSESEIDADGIETILKAFASYGISSDENENGYAPWLEAGSEYSDFIKIQLPSEGETKSWLCNSTSNDMLSYMTNVAPILVADRNMTFSLTGLGENRYRVSFLWETNDEAAEKTVRTKSIKTSLVRNDDSVTESLQSMSGLMQSVAGTVNSRIVMERTYPINNADQLTAYVVIGDSEGTVVVDDD